MILIYGIPSESPIRRLTDQLDQKEFPYLMLDQRDHKETKITHDLTENSMLHYFDLQYKLSSFTGLYIRSMDPRSLPDLVDKNMNHPDLQHANGLSSTIWEWSDITPSLVVNSRKSMASNGSKPYQAQIITKVGFSTPNTLISNDVKEVLQFQKKIGRAIYKSASGVRSIVSELNIGDENKLEKIKNCPVQFQEYVNGTDWRVHVIGEKCFCTKISTSGIDYRYAHKEKNGTTDLAPGNLPKKITDRCVALSKELGLHFSGIDLRITEDGVPYCFEANPSPAYSYYESHTGQPIAEALADYLIDNALTNNFRVW